jgi:hypothetical protein
MSQASECKARVVLVMWILAAAVAISTRPAEASNPGLQEPARLRIATASRFDADVQKDPPAILTAARVIYVYSRTVFVKSEVIENELLKRREFQQAGLLITKDPKAADLTMEVRRSNLTTEYPYVVVDTKTKLVVASGKVNSLFGTAAGKIAKEFMKQVKEARMPAAAKPKK